ncbi:MAG: D-threo-aldose 1-dehydrogenase [Nocardioidaceae bacterium]|nr:D-threo-aldose 1-dehydrogenase [Nocardioidaceae bacterium]
MPVTSASTPTRLGLGGAGIGNHRVAMTDAAARQVLDEAWSVRVRLFDTAPHYGLGLSERRLGDFLQSKPRTQFQVSSKVGRLLVPQANPEGALDDEGFLVPADARRAWDFSAEGVRTSVAQSLTRLGLEFIDAVYLHDPERWDLDAALAEGLPALQSLQDEGLVGRIGVASMKVEALLAAARTGQVDELMVAGRYTLVDQGAAELLLPMCEDKGIAVVAAAVFNGGLLAGTPSADSTFDYAAVPPEVLRRAEQLELDCTAAGVPLAAAAMQFPLRHPAVRSVVVGAVEPGQMETNARLLATPVPEALWAQLAQRDRVRT